MSAYEQVAALLLYSLQVARLEKREQWWEGVKAVSGERALARPGPPTTSEPAITI